MKLKSVCKSLYKNYISYHKQWHDPIGCVSKFGLICLIVFPTALVLSCAICAQFQQSMKMRPEWHDPLECLDLFCEKFRCMNWEKMMDFSNNCCSDQGSGDVTSLMSVLFGELHNWRDSIRYRYQHSCGCTEITSGLLFHLVYSELLQFKWYLAGWSWLRWTWPCWLQSWHHTPNQSA